MEIVDHLQFRSAMIFQVNVTLILTPAGMIIQDHIVQVELIKLITAIVKKYKY